MSAVFCDGAGKEIKVGDVLADSCGCCISTESIGIVRDFTENYIHVDKFQRGFWYSDYATGKRCFAPYHGGDCWRVVKGQYARGERCYIKGLLSEGDVRKMLNIVDGEGSNGIL